MIRTISAEDRSLLPHRSQCFWASLAFDSVKKHLPTLHKKDRRLEDQLDLGNAFVAEGLRKRQGPLLQSDPLKKSLVEVTW